MSSRPDTVRTPGSYPCVSPPPGWLTDFVEASAEFVPPEPLVPGKGGRPAAVLILFGAGPDGPDLLLIQRSSALRKHAGQPAFPGGALDRGDRGAVDAALREAAEETGLNRAGVDVLATLPELFIHRSGYRVTPVVAWWREPSEVSAADPGEVAAVARVPVAELVEPGNRLLVRNPNGSSSPAFRVCRMLVWGFTAALLDRMLAIGGWELPWDHGRVEDLPAEVITLAGRA